MSTAPHNTTPACRRCHGTGFLSAAFYTCAKPCNCGWQPGGELRAAAQASYDAELAERDAARAARRAARKAAR